VDKPRTGSRSSRLRYGLDYTDRILPEHVQLLRGLAWCCGLREDADLARALARLAVSAYRTIPGKGPRLVSLGNACVTALRLMPGRASFGPLTVLKAGVKFGTAQKEIDWAFQAAVMRERLTADQIAELAGHSSGLGEPGLNRPSPAGRTIRRS